MNKSVYTLASSIRLDTGWVVTDGYLCAVVRTSGSPPRPFRSGESQRGSWVGTVDKAQGNLPVQVQIGIDRDVTVRVKGLALEQSFLAGGLYRETADAEKPIPLGKLGPLEKTKGVVESW